jgi:hypothetical protein
MASCLILGDSIAAGIAAALNAIQPGACDVYTRVGASTAAVTSMAPRASYRYAILSTGSNDRGNAHFLADAVRLRLAVKARSVTWVYPREAAQAWRIYRVASASRDRTVSLSHLTSHDGVHPDSYARALWTVLAIGRTDKPGNRQAYPCMESAGQRLRRSAKDIWPSNSARTIMKARCALP